MWGPGRQTGNSHSNNNNNDNDCRVRGSHTLFVVATEDGYPASYNIENGGRQSRVEGKGSSRDDIYTSHPIPLLQHIHPPSMISSPSSDPRTEPTYHGFPSLVIHIIPQPHSSIRTSRILSHCSSSPSRFIPHSHAQHPPVAAPQHYKLPLTTPPPPPSRQSKPKENFTPPLPFPHTLYSA